MKFYTLWQVSFVFKFTAVSLHGLWKLSIIEVKQRDCHRHEAFSLCSWNNNRNEIIQQETTVNVSVFSGNRFNMKCSLFFVGEQPIIWGTCFIYSVDLFHKPSRTVIPSFFKSRYINSYKQTSLLWSINYTVTLRNSTL